MGFTEITTFDEMLAAFDTAQGLVICGRGANGWMDAVEVVGPPVAKHLLVFGPDTYPYVVETDGAKAVKHYRLNHLQDLIDRLPRKDALFVKGCVAEFVQRYKCLLSEAEAQAQMNTYRRRGGALH